VRRLLIEEGADIKKEYYVAVLTDRATQKVAMMGSSEGGMDIEKVAHDTPEKIIRIFIDPIDGLGDGAARELAAGIGIPKEAEAQAVDVFKKLYACYMETDASLVEINPLILEGGKNGGPQATRALDAKFNFDSNAIYRHPEIAAYRDLDEEDPAEIAASKYDLAYIQLDGNIGCLVNGAGLAMATMDTIKLFGGSPANFLDVGGGASAEKVTEAFKIMLGNPKVKAILVNIFGGIMRCDTIAEGVIAACKATNLTVPLVVRMKGRTRSSARSSSPTRACRSSAPTRWPRPRRRSWRPSSEHPDRQANACHHAGHHRQDRPVPHAHVPRLRERTRVLRRRRQSEEGGRGFRGHPDLRDGQGSGEEHGRDGERDLRAAAGAAAAIWEAVEAELDLAICITEGIPVRDLLEVRSRMRKREAAGGKKTLLLGPNCPGLITPDEIKIGIMPGHIHKKGRIGVVSRSGTLTYEAVAQLTDVGLGQSSAVGIGGDPINGLKHIDVMKLFNDDPGTDAVVMIGEIGGSDEADAARWCKANMTKPIVGFIAGVTAPPGKRMGHAGALISGGADTADAKLAVMEECGFTVTRNPSEMGRLMKALV
jgi:succinyl-CoA synthetase beta subunit/succinyl-CoA synthetase alpha subunit